MTNLIIQVAKYLIIILMVLYTVQCFTVFRKRDDDAREYLFLRQNMLMFVMHFVAFTVLYLERGEMKVLLFYAAQALFLAAVLVLFRNLYPLASKLLINNMCMLICIGFIMITRLKFDMCVKQFKIAIGAMIVALLVPLVIRKLRFITKMYWFYTLIGIGLLALVAIAARSTYGAKLSFDLGPISIQPSEFVKIIYVFAIAGLLSNAKDFRRIIIATALAAVHVLILVVSKDLGSALIFFITYLVMLFVSTRNPFLVLSGILAGSGAAVGAYFLFNHVRVRVHAWQDPFKDYQGGGYQICQSLFAISAGGWFGTGLCQGSPNAIPFVEQDSMFPAIAEELGSIFGICLILVCMSCFIMFVNIAMQLTNRFYRLVAVGLGSTYAVQVFLTIGGGIKLIPLTGVTLPLVSYGGSSMLSTLIMFSIVQGLYMLQRDEELKAAAATHTPDLAPQNSPYSYGQQDDSYYEDDDRQNDDYNGSYYDGMSGQDADYSGSYYDETSGQNAEYNDSYYEDSTDQDGGYYYDEPEDSAQMYPYDDRYAQDDSFSYEDGGLYDNGYGQDADYPYKNGGSYGQEENNAYGYSNQYGQENRTSGRKKSRTRR